MKRIARIAAGQMAQRTRLQGTLARAVVWDKLTQRATAHHSSWDPWNLLAKVIVATLMLAMWMNQPSWLLGQDGIQPETAEAAALVEVLSSDTTVFDKAMACRRLAVVGDDNAVEALSALLSDDQLATYARSALELIPGPAAGEALRKAVSRLEGELLAGVLSSIGRRRDAAATDTLSGLLQDTNPQVAAVAARALGYVGSPPAAERLQDTLAKSSGSRRPALATACLICAERLQQQGRRDLAVSLCSAVQKADVPEHLALAATHMAIVAQGNDGLPLLIQQLNDGGEARFRLALQAARDLGDMACKPLIDHFHSQSSSRQSLMILALTDIGSQAALPVIIDAARGGAKPVRLEAIHALGRLGGSAAIPILLAAAVEQDPQVAQVAQSTLAVLQSDEVNLAITNMLDGGVPESLEVAIQLAGQRNIARATPALLRLATGPDASVRPAAIQSLGSTVQLKDLPSLIALATAPSATDLHDVAAQSLTAACARLPKEACAEKLAAAMDGAPTQMQVLLLEQIAAVGGVQALRTVAAAADRPDDDLQDTATRLLGTWMTADAAPELLNLARTLTNENYRTRALRGYLRIARQLKMTPEERLVVCRNALALAKRNEERQLALQTAGRVGTLQAAAFAAAYLDDPELREPACAAVLDIAKNVLATSPNEIEPHLKRVAAVTTNPATADRATSLLAQLRESSEP